MGRGLLLFTLLVIISINSSLAAECHQTYMDLVLIADASGSMGFENFKIQRQFMQEFISKLAIDEGTVRLAIVVFGSRARVEFSLAQFNRREEIFDAISKIYYDDTRTNVAAALRLTGTDVFTREGGDRENATNVAVLIADGGPTEEVDYTYVEAKKLKDSGVRIILLAITYYTDMFATIASAPTSDNVIFIDRFSQLDSVHKTLYSSVCRVGTASSTGTKTATKSRTTRTSATKSTSDSATITAQPASITDTTSSQITTTTTATTSTSTTSIAPVSTTTIRSTSNKTPTTPTQDKATPTTTPTAPMVTNPTATTNTTGSSTSVPGRVNVSVGVTATITAALQTCYDLCASPVGATSTLFNVIRSLRLDKEDLSKQRREKTSASDVRPSATIVATLVLAIVWTPILGLVIWDLIDLCRNRHI